MTITTHELKLLLTLVATTQADEITCDGCFDLIAEFTDNDRRDADLPLAMNAVQTHLSQCVCCAYEYAALLEAIQTAETKPI